MITNSLAGKTILITDVDHFVGPTTCLALAELGAEVLCHDESFTDPDARDAFEEKNAGCLAAAAQTPEMLAEEARTRLGTIDVLINNDSYPAIRAPLDEADAQLFRETLEKLTIRPFALAAAVASDMKEQKSGKIIFITSAAPLRGVPNYSIYAAARGATNSLVNSLAQELGRHNIQVNAIAPNYVDNPTYFPKELMAKPEAAAKILKNIPLGRLGTPDESASLVAFLASDNSNFITGQIIPFAGGWA